MAIKDWKKIIDDKGTIGWKTKPIRGVDITDTLRVWKADKNEWVLRVYRKDSFSSQIIKDKTFKTKSQALRYAKDYMKRSLSVNTRSKAITKGIGQLSRRIR